MLSDDLMALRETLRKFERNGVRMNDVAVRRICSILETASNDAKGLENHAVKAQPCRAFEVNDSIVNLDEARRRRAQEWLEDQGVVVISPSTDPGGAA